MHGWVKVVADPQALAAQRTWWIGGVECAVEEARAHSGKLIAKLAGVESREQALKLKGKKVAVPRAALPEPARGTYYWADLVGLEVRNAGGEALGTVRTLFSNGAHDVMEVAGERTRLLPWVSAVVRRVDLAAGRIEVEWEADW